MAVNSTNTVITELGLAGKVQFPYTPYGRRPAQHESNNPLAFNGEQLDTVTGCYLLGNGYRLYNPTLMRFCSPDNLSPFEQGGPNAYAYCSGNPVNRVDPSGHFSKALLAGALFSALGTGAAIGAAKVKSRGAKIALGIISAISYAISVFLHSKGLTSSASRAASPEVPSLQTSARTDSSSLNEAAGLTPMFNDWFERRTLVFLDRGPPPAYDPPPSYESTFPQGTQNSGIASRSNSLDASKGSIRAN